MTYVNWNIGEPNYGDQIEACMHLWGPYSNQWNDMDCMVEFCAVCEIDAWVRSTITLMVINNISEILNRIGISLVQRLNYIATESSQHRHLILCTFVIVVLNCTLVSCKNTTLVRCHWFQVNTRKSVVGMNRRQMYAVMPLRSVVFNYLAERHMSLFGHRSMSVCLFFKLQLFIARVPHPHLPLPRPLQAERSVVENND